MFYFVGVTRVINMCFKCYTSHKRLLQCITSHSRDSFMYYMSHQGLSRVLQMLQVALVEIITCVTGHTSRDYFLCYRSVLEWKESLLEYLSSW